MTMHLLGPAYTTTNGRKRKSKTTTSKHTKLAMDWLEDCRFCKRLGIKPKTFEEYKQYRAGNYKLAYERAKLEVSSNYIVGQAYNKGGLVVLSKSDAADPATGKRRC